MQTFKNLMSSLKNNKTQTKLSPAAPTTPAPTSNNQRTSVPAIYSRSSGATKPAVFNNKYIRTALITLGSSLIGCGFISYVGMNRFSPAWTAGPAALITMMATGARAFDEESTQVDDDTDLKEKLRKAHLSNSSLQQTVLSSLSYQRAMEDRITDLAVALDVNRQELQRASQDNGSLATAVHQLQTYMKAISEPNSINQTPANYGDNQTSSREYGSIPEPPEVDETYEGEPMFYEEMQLPEEVRPTVNVVRANLEKDGKVKTTAQSAAGIDSRDPWED
jgi:hypothetical protein